MVQPCAADFRHGPDAADHARGPPRSASRQEARPILGTAFREAVANGKSFDLTLPALRRDGTRLWVRCVGDAEVADDRTVRVSGAVQDVTEQHEADLRLRRASRSSFQGHWEYDFGTDQVWCSEAYQQLLGYLRR